MFLALYLATLVLGYRLRPERGGAARALVPWTTWASPLLFAPAAYALFGPWSYPMGPSVVVVSTSLSVLTLPPLLWLLL